MAARYEGIPQVELLAGRNIKLMTDLSFIDDSETRWSVPKGAQVDGASIPRVFWSVVGGPLDGGYRDASIIHDWYCDKRTRTWQATHRVFYDAMIVSRVAVAQAKIMYYAVLWGGPRWEERVTFNNNLGADFIEGLGRDMSFGAAASSIRIPPLTETEQVEVARPNQNLAEAEQREVAAAMAGLIEADDLSLDQIEALAEQERPPV